ncbi:MAG: hypothetical protein IPN46_06060 [Saprospiraceae bacterium]|jgi:hypothetical protein|nr:hypothetical protein [Saprospiraceae bacterium]
MYSNVIFIELYNKDKIETLLHRWIKEYRESIDKNIEFQIIRDKEGKFIVKIDGIISNYHFYFLVNFLSNPTSEISNYHIKGYTKGTENNILKDIFHLVYVSPDDTEGDNVYCVTEHDENYKIGFDGKIVHLFELVKYKYQNEVIIKNKVKTVKFSDILSEERSKNKLENSKIILRSNFLQKVFYFIYSFLLILSLLFENLHSINQAYAIVSVLLIFWLLVDDQMLQQEKLYKRSLILGIFGFILNLLVLYISKIKNQSSFPVFFGHSAPIFLVLQFFLRRAFIKLFNSEPKTILFTGSIAEVFYTILLIISFFVIPLLLSEFFYKIIS